MTEDEAPTLRGRPIDPKWGKFLDRPDEFLNDQCRASYEQAQRLERDYPNLPHWDGTLSLDEWVQQLRALNPGAGYAQPSTVAPDRVLSQKPPLDAESVIADWHQFCRAEARAIKSSIRRANEEGDGDDAARIRIPFTIRAPDWRAA